LLLEGQVCADPLGVCGKNDTLSLIGEPISTLGFNNGESSRYTTEIPANYFCTYNKIDNTMDLKDYSVQIKN